MYNVADGGRTVTSSLGTVGVLHLFYVVDETAYVP